MDSITGASTRFEVPPPATACFGPIWIFERGSFMWRDPFVCKPLWTTESERETHAQTYIRKVCKYPCVQIQYVNLGPWKFQVRFRPTLKIPETCRMARLDIINQEISWSHEDRKRQLHIVCDILLENQNNILLKSRNIGWDILGIDVYMSSQSLFRKDLYTTARRIHTQWTYNKNTIFIVGVPVTSHLVTGDWDPFLCPVERARAEAGLGPQSRSWAVQWVLERRKFPVFAVEHPWDSHYKFSK